jgi:hypothetical protein
LTVNPTIEPRLLELLDTSKRRFQQLLQDENATQEDLFSCQVAIQYCLAEIEAHRNAMKSKKSVLAFIKSLFTRHAPEASPAMS